MAYTLKLLSGTIGAEIQGINLNQPFTEETKQEIRQLLLDHEVIFFRDQNISRTQHIALARIFGPLQSHPAYATAPGFPEITILESTSEKPSKIDTWHSDMTFRKHPPVGTVLRSKIIPAKGGDTLFSSMTAAYNALSDRMKIYLSDLEAVHDFSYGFRESLAEPGGRERLAKAVADNPPITHPVIQIHPESGKKVIFVNKLFTTHILGIDRRESDAILNFLFDHVKIEEFTCRFKWTPNAIAIWDNRASQHKPVNDYFPAHRCLERTVIDGDVPY